MRRSVRCSVRLRASVLLLLRSEEGKNSHFLLRTTIHKFNPRLLYHVEFLPQCDAQANRLRRPMILPLVNSPVWRNCRPLHLKACSLRNLYPETKTSTKTPFPWSGESPERRRNSLVLPFSPKSRDWLKTATIRITCLFANPQIFA